MDEGLTERFEAASRWAVHLHADHVRKGPKPIPYVSHLFAVASLVFEDGGTEDEAIAALLHDAVEDGKTELAEIERRFGADVARMVHECSDTEVIPKPAWRERKANYIAHLRDEHTSAGALRVSNADKVHNARCLVRDYREIGEKLWERFNEDARNADAQLGYYEALASAFNDRRAGSWLVEELGATVASLRSLVSANAGAQRG